MNQATVTVACCRCRKQKLRCTREQPQCRRCQRANKQCSYPPPPDRKRLAIKRARARSPSVHTVASSKSDPPTQHHSPNPSLHRNVLDDALSRAHPDIGAELLRGSPLQRAEGPSVRRVMDTVPRTSNDLEGVGLADEVALFLIEVYFERHYQAELLFRKQAFIEDYLAQSLPRFVFQAVFAFATLFLTHVPGGIINGDVGITEISQVDWCLIGERWAEQSSKSALINADRPCLPHVQAFQILALFWLAKSESMRTNIHTAIAYRTCRILQFNQLNPDWKVRCCVESELKMRCFWACWLTQCASQENARFQTDCWAEIVGCPLPDDISIGYMPSSRRFLDEAGKIKQDAGIPENTRLGFHSVLVMLHGLWWEVQTFVYSLRQHHGNPCDPTIKIFMLDEKLEDLHHHMDASIQYDASGVGDSNISSVSSRIFSLNYLYHLCLCYLHSSVVPLFSSGTQRINQSRKTLRIAAEQAWKHSSIMVEMTERFLTRKGVISKLWPIVGYGAYVCAAIQLRCLLALERLSNRQLERLTALLRVTGELRNYWKNLQPLHAHMEQQFLQAQNLASSQRESCNQSEWSRQELACLVDERNPSLVSALPPSISTYIADEDRPKPNTTDASSESGFIVPTGLTYDTLCEGNPGTSFPPRCHPFYCPSMARGPAIEHETTTTEPIDTNRADEGPGIIQANVPWWDPAPITLEGVFGQSFLGPGFPFHMDMY